MSVTESTLRRPYIDRFTSSFGGGATSTGPLDAPGTAPGTRRTLGPLVGRTAEGSGPTGSACTAVSTGSGAAGCTGGGGGIAAVTGGTTAVLSGAACVTSAGGVSGALPPPPRRSTSPE